MSAPPKELTMRNLVKHGLLAVSLSTLAGLASCGGDKPPQEPSSMNTTAATTPATAPMPESRPPPPEPMPADTGSITSTPPEPTPPPKEKTLTDAEIIQVTSTANTGEIEMAQMAAKSATNADVKNFAAMMLTQHRDME